MSALRPALRTAEAVVDQMEVIGVNPGHDKHIQKVKEMVQRRKHSFAKVLKDIMKNRNFGANHPRNIFPPKLRRSKKNKKENRATTAPLGENIKPPVMAWMD